MSTFRQELRMKILCQERSIHSFDPEVLIDVVANTGFDQRLLRGGQFSGSLSRIALPNLRIDKGCYTLPCFARGSASSQWVMVGMTFTAEQAAWVNGRDTYFDDFQLYAENAAVDYRTVPDSPWVALQVARDWLQVQAIELTGREIPYPQHGFQNVVVPRWAAMQLRAEIEALIVSQRDLPLEQMNLAADRWERRLVTTLVTALSHATPDRPSLDMQTRRKKRLMEAVEHYLIHHITEDVRLEDLVRFTGTEERSLQRHCSEIYGLTPKQLLGIVRLNLIRGELLRPENKYAKVRTIAQKWGIRHQGRFAARYEELFGEKPSETTPRFVKM